MDLKLEDLVGDFPFEINLEANQLIMDAYGIDSEEAHEMLAGFIIEVGSHSKIGELELGRGARTVAVTREYETSQGLKDLFLFVYIENVGEDEEYSQLEGMIIRIDIVDVGEVPDTYLDFMNMTRDTKEDKEQEE
jgi:hypothetical protein